MPLKTKEEILNANSINLPEFLMAQGENLVPSGRGYRIKEHSSLFIQEKMWYWNSRSKGGNNIKFVMEYYNKSFPEAVDMLNGNRSLVNTITYRNENRPPTKPIEHQKHEIHIEESTNCKRALAYLSVTRGLDYNMVLELVKQGKITQDIKNNAVFRITDENNVTVGAEMVGTSTEFRFKGIAPGSAYGYGFEVCKGKGENALFFESSIDMLSYMQMYRNELDNHRLISMIGVKPGTVEETMKRYNIPPEKVYLCVDNDTAGDNFVNRLKQKYPEMHRISTIDSCKDWNEQLNKGIFEKNVDFTALMRYNEGEDMVNVNEVRNDYTTSIKQITSSAEEWENFLRFSAHLNISDTQQKHSFSSKLLIYSENPDVTECKTFAEWKNENNAVKFGSRGIPVLTDNAKGEPVVTHVFDVSQTVNPPERSDRNITPENANAVIEALTNAYGYSDMYIESIISAIVNDEVQTANLSDEKKAILSQSICFQLFEKFGLDVDYDYNMFDGITNMSVMDIAEIGCAMNNIVAPLENIIETTIIHESERSNENERLHEQGRNGIYMERGSSATLSDVSTGEQQVVQTGHGNMDIYPDDDQYINSSGRNGQIWFDENEIFGEPQDSFMVEPDLGEQTVRPLHGSERGSSESDRPNNRAEIENSGIYGSTERLSSDSTAQESVPNGSGRTDTSRTDIRIDNNIIDETAETEKASVVFSCYEKLKEDVLADERIINAAKNSDRENLNIELEKVIFQKGMEIFNENIYGNIDFYADFISKEKTKNRIEVENEILNAVETMIQSHSEVNINETTNDKEQSDVLESTSFKNTELSAEIYDTDNPNIFKIRDGAYLVNVEVTTSTEMWERFKACGIEPKAEDENRLMFETDGANWMRYYIPDRFGNKWNSIDARDVCSPEEMAVLKQIIAKIVPSEGIEKAVEDETISKRTKDGNEILGNTPFRFIPKKTYTKVKSDIANDVAAQLEEKGIKFSGVIKGDIATFTTSKSDKQAIDEIVGTLAPVNKTADKEELHRYYSTHREDGAFPDSDERINTAVFEEKQYIPEIDRNAYGYAEYSKPLTEREINDYDLTSETDKNLIQLTFIEDNSEPFTEKINIDETSEQTVDSKYDSMFEALDSGAYLSVSESVSPGNQTTIEEISNNAKESEFENMKISHNETGYTVTADINGINLVDNSVVLSEFGEDKAAVVEYIENNNLTVDDNQRTISDISIGDKYLYQGTEYTVTSLMGIYPNDVGISEYMDGFEITKNIDKYKLHRDGEYLGNDEKTTPVSEKSEKKAPEQKKKFNTLEHRNYKKMEKLFPEIMDGNHSYQRYEKSNESGFEPLSVEKISKDTLSIMHTYIQNGDVMRDPDIVVKIDNDNQTIKPLSYEQSALAMYQEFNDGSKSQRDCSRFLNNWLDNLENTNMSLIRAVVSYELDNNEYDIYVSYKDGKIADIQGDERAVADYIQKNGISLESEPIKAAENNDIDDISDFNTFEQEEQLSFETELSDMVQEKNIEVVQSIEIGDEITLNDREFVIESINGDFSMNMIPKDKSNEQLELEGRMFVGNWKQQLVEEAGNNPIFVIKSDVAKALEKETQLEEKADVNHSCEVRVSRALNVSDGLAIHIKDTGVMNTHALVYGTYPDYKSAVTAMSELRKGIESNSEFAAELFEKCPYYEREITKNMEITLDGEKYNVFDFDRLANTVDLIKSEDMDLSVPYTMIKDNPEIPIRTEKFDYIDSLVNEQSADIKKESNLDNNINNEFPNGEQIENVSTKEQTEAVNTIIEDKLITSEKSESEMSNVIADTDLDTDDNMTEKDVELVTETEQLTEQENIESESKVSASPYFHIADEHLGEGGAKEKFNNNIAAIKLLKEIESEERQATSEEQEQLSKYVGWGGLSKAFDENALDWRNEYFELKDLLTEDEYDSARKSTLDSFYTSPVIIEAIYKALDNMGFNGGDILEPSMGTGNFFGMLPDKIRDNSDLTGVELDGISGRIARQLYPEANISINGFEKMKFDNNQFDLAIGNVPFGDISLHDNKKAYKNLKIHDYFFAKSIDKVRSGGIVAFVTSSGTMDKQDTSVRKMIAQKCDLLGAIRLPNTAFKKNAGTEVTSDIIFLQKREKPLKESELADCNWIHIGKSENGLPINQYFVDNPQMVLGTLEKSSFRDNIICKALPDSDLKSQLAEAIKNIKGTYEEPEFQPELDEKSSDILTATPDIPNYTYTLVDEKLYFRHDDNLIPLKDSEQSGIKFKRRKGMCEIADTVKELLNAQIENRPDDVIEKLQQKLNTQYDNFVAKFGYINKIDNKNPNSIFRNDVRYPLLQSLEITDGEKYIGKANIFTERTITPHKAVEHTDTSSEALIVSMAETAKVDLDYMSELTGFDKEKIIDDLKGVIYPVPEFSADDNIVYQTAEEYLSGNIYEKLDVAKMAAEDNPVFRENIAALEQAMPKPLTAGEITIKLGATWIDPKLIQQFMYETFNTPQYFREYENVSYQKNREAISVEYSDIGKGEWRISNKNNDKNNVTVNNTFGTSEMNAYHLLENILNQRSSPKIYDEVKTPDGTKHKSVNRKETEALQLKTQLIKNSFADWIFKDPERREKLVSQYNELFNCIKPREYDGSHIKFSGINPEIKLREHQVNAIAHALFGGNTLFAHEVGAGKTFEMIATAMEGKRLGLHNKSLFVVPNHLTEQIGTDFMKLYPNANILVAKPKDFSSHNRKKMCSKIATGNFDAVIIGHSQLIKIPVAPEVEQKFIRNQINEITTALESAKENEGSRFTVKQLEKTKKNLEEKLNKLLNSTTKDSTVTFEELGIDKLFVDEAHLFKNLYLSTKMNNIAGITTNDNVQKTQDLFLKCQYLDEKTGNRGITFATGTPVITGYQRSKMPILRCLCRTASQENVVLSCFFKAQLCSHRQDYKSQHHYSSHTEPFYTLHRYYAEYRTIYTKH